MKHIKRKQIIIQAMKEDEKETILILFSLYDF